MNQDTYIAVNSNRYIYLSLIDYKWKIAKESNSL